MLTGDSSAAAGAVAQSIGIEHVQAGTLPGQKAKRVQALQVGREGGREGGVGEAESIGLEHVQAGTLPGQKAKRVHALQVGREGGREGRRS